MVRYKLHYFQSRGGGECIRLIFHYAGVDFEDKRYTMEEFRNGPKSNMPFNQLPVLEVDGLKLPQSRAIYRYLGRKYGLIPTDPFEVAIVDSIGDALQDFYVDTRNFIYVCFGIIEGDRDTFYKELYLPAAEKYFPAIKNYINEASNGYVVRGGPTWVDFYMAEFFDTLNNIVPGFYEDHPEFKKLNEKVHALPQLQKYLKERPPLPR